jgi:hypothetical protein
VFPFHYRRIFKHTISPDLLTTLIQQFAHRIITMLFQNVVVALSLAAVSMARVAQPVIRSEGAMCFDAGDCILVG